MSEQRGTDEEGHDEGATPPPRAAPGRGVTGRVKGAASSVERKYTSVDRGVRGWTDRQEAAASHAGVAIGAYRHYRDADGAFYSLVLTAFFFVTLLPAALVLEAYAAANPEAGADTVIRRLSLSGATADLVRSVLAGAGGHKLNATLIAVFSAVIFGLGIGRALQLVHARAWGIEPRRHWLWDQARYLAWFFAFLALIVLLILQNAYLPDDWVQWLLAPVWALVIVAFFVWTPRFLLHNRLSVIDVLPGAILVTVGLLVLRLVSQIVLRNWLDWYSTYYGALGVIMAIFFWLLIAATILVVAAAVSPAYAERRRLRRPGGG
jgi:uncharacterized BrkB/YihY/UPF0761 family membrane protein